MNKVKILVVEDEIIIADNICDTLNNLGYEALDPAINYTEAINVIEKEKPDIAILDIQLSGKKTGIDVAEYINKNHNSPYIFLTSNSNVRTVSEAKKVSPSAFLLKPFTKEELYSSIEIALFNYSQKKERIDDNNLIIHDSIFIKDKGVFVKCLFSDILYIKSAHVYIEIILKNNKKQIIRSSLNDIINKLSDKFIRVHRGYIVNTDYLEQMNHAYLRITNEDIPIGKKYREVLLNRINLV